VIGQIVSPSVAGSSAQNLKSYQRRCGRIRLGLLWKSPLSDRAQKKKNDVYTHAVRKFGTTEEKERYGSVQTLGEPESKINRGGGSEDSPKSVC